MKAERVLPITLFVALAITFWRANADKSNIHFPRPYRFVGVAVTWTVLAVLATAAPPLAAAFAIAFDVILALRPYSGDVAGMSTAPTAPTVLGTPLTGQAILDLGARPINPQTPAQQSAAQDFMQYLLGTTPKPAPNPAMGGGGGGIKVL